MNILWFLLQTFYFLLPAGFANMAPIFAAKLFPHWNFPLDGKKSWGGQRIFGDNKTLRGLVAGLLFGWGVFAIQKFLSQKIDFFSRLGLIPYQDLSPFWGAWMGVGALIGDAIKSFFKRRRHLSPGKSWIPFDQVDWILGVFLFLAPFWGDQKFFLPTFLTSAFMGPLLSYLIHRIGYTLHLTKDPF